jgi:hypothetical protein
MSISGRNLTDSAVEFYQDTDQGRVKTGFAKTGVSLSIGLGYAR